MASPDESARKRPRQGRVNQLGGQKRPRLGRTGQATQAPPTTPTGAQVVDPVLTPIPSTRKNDVRKVRFDLRRTTTFKYVYKCGGPCAFQTVRKNELWAHAVVHGGQEPELVPNLPPDTPAPQPSVPLQPCPKAQPGRSRGCKRKSPAATSGPDPDLDPASPLGHDPGRRRDTPPRESVRARTPPEPPNRVPVALGVAVAPPPGSTSVHQETCQPARTGPPGGVQ